MLFPWGRKPRLTRVEKLRADIASARVAIGLAVREADQDHANNLAQEIEAKKKEILGLQRLGREARAGYVRETLDGGW